MIWFEEEGSENTSERVIQAPFNTAGQAMVAVLLLVALYFVPVFLEEFSPPDPAETYLGVPPVYGNYATIGAELMSEDDIDVLIVGASDAWTALDPLIVRGHLERKFSRKMRVLNLSTNWAGEDRSAQIVHDVLRKSRVRVLLLPESDAIQTAPHELAKYWWRGSIDTSGLPWPSRAQLALMRTVGLPRQVWSRMQDAEGLTKGLAPPYEEYLRGQREALGFNAAKTGWKSHAESDETKRRAYVEKIAPSPQMSAENLFLQTNSQEFFEVRPTPYTLLQTHFVALMRDMVRAQGGVFATFSIPSHFQSVPLEKAWLREHQGISRDWETIGISQTKLFPGLSFSEMLDFYGNESHLNLSGARAYTGALLPAIERLYAQSVTR